jgi:aspartate ammonia-lyase
MATVVRSATRMEKDSLGTKEIPGDVYYGIQTARAVENYPISGMRAHPTLIRAFGMVKQAAALSASSAPRLSSRRRKKSPTAGGTRSSWWTSSRPVPVSAST